MPIEIKELNIRINVCDDQPGASAGGARIDEETRQSIVAQCVEQVMEIISKNQDR
ncbi:MAG: hypothetical protein JNL03_01250 [Prolixibacteraceae bacterium]|nr:hypothetical protein [Prolixibacteraceae bacterium]